MKTMMRLLTIALLAGLVVGVSGAPAKACSYHGATPPHIVRVDNSVATTVSLQVAY